MKKIVLSFLSCAMMAGASWASATFNETYSERLVAIRMDGEVFREVLPGGSFTLRSRVSLTESDFSSAPSRETAVKITVGGWSFEGVLSDDPRYVPGKSRSARLPIVVDGIRCGDVSIAVSRGVMTFSVKAKTGVSAKGQEFKDSPFASAQTSGESRKITLGEGLAVSCSISFFDINAAATIPVAGTERYSVRRVGRGDDAEEYELSAVRLRGSASMERVVPEPES
jgi:hypothetical protein